MNFQRIFNEIHLQNYFSGIVSRWNSLCATGAGSSAGLDN